MTDKNNNKTDTPLNKKTNQAGTRQGGRIVAALDIGSSKICCFIADIGAHGGMEVIGIGHQASKGVKAGSIIDLKTTETAIAHAVEAAEMMARERLQNRPITSVFVNVPATKIFSHVLDVTTRVSSREVDDRDIRSALTHARSVTAHGKDELIHVIPGPYTLDRQRGIADARGMRGSALGVRIQAVTAMTGTMRNIAHVTGHNHLDIDGFCASPYAAGLAALVDDEKDLGCTVIDMGGGNTSIAVFAEGRLIFSAAIPVGGRHVTNDLARGLLTSIADAERLKTLHGSVMALPSDDGTMIDVPPIGEEEHAQPNYIPKSQMAGIIQPRIEETFELVRAKLVDNGIFDRIGRRVVLTGGASQLSGVPEIAQAILDKQVRLGRPHRIRGLAEATGGPAFATCAGLLHYAAEHADEIPALEKPQVFSLNLPFKTIFFQKVTHWLKENW